MVEEKLRKYILSKKVSSFTLRGVKYRPGNIVPYEDEDYARTHGDIPDWLIPYDEEVVKPVRKFETELASRAVSGASPAAIERAKLDSVSEMDIIATLKPKEKVVRKSRVRSNEE